MMENRCFEGTVERDKAASDAFFNDATIPSFSSAAQTQLRNADSTHLQNVSSGPKGVVNLNDSLRTGSKASELCGSMNTNSIQKKNVSPLNQIQEMLLMTRERFIRSAPSFQLFLDVQQFSKPCTGGMIVDRMERNFRFFFYNYLLVCLMLFLLCAFFNPTILIFFLICAGICGFVSHRGQTIKINDSVTLSVQQFQGCVVSIGTVCMLLFAGNVIMMTLFGCAILVCIHASLHLGVSYERIAQIQAEQQVHDTV